MLRVPKPRQLPSVRAASTRSLRPFDALSLYPLGNMQRELRILKDEFDPFEIPLLELRIPLLIDPLDDRPEQIVFVAVQRPHFTDYHLRPRYRGGLHRLHGPYCCFASANEIGILLRLNELQPSR